VTIRLSIDRFEGDRKQTAVLLTDDGSRSTSPGLSWGSSPIRAKTCGSVLCAMLRGRLTGGESSTSSPPG
jgi:hypothetical protein